MGSQQAHYKQAWFHTLPLQAVCERRRLRKKYAQLLVSLLYFDYGVLLGMVPNEITALCIMYVNCSYKIVCYMQRVQERGALHDVTCLAQHGGIQSTELP